MSTRAARGQAPDLIEEVTRRLSEGVDELRAYLASPEGQQVRKRVAQFAIIGAPLIFRMRFFRATPLGRILGMVGGAALVVKMAEALRDWDPVKKLETLDLG